MTRKPVHDPEQRPSVLVVEGEHDLQELLRFNLHRDGYTVMVADTGEQAMKLARQNRPGLILLDLMLPHMDGLEVCRAIKSDAALLDVPIIMVTAKGEDADVVTGLELGADDYITKPFSPRVLMARVRAVMRRAQEQAQSPDKDDAAPIQRDRLTIYTDRHEALVDGKRLDLTATEFRLLVLLVRRPGRVFTRQQIIEAVHGGHSAVTDRSVDVQVVSLRRKMGEQADLIQTIRGVGYRFRE